MNEATLGVKMTSTRATGLDRPKRSSTVGRILMSGPAVLAALTLMACSDVAEDEAFNHADVMFARMMVPHHEQAIEMSDLVLDAGDVDPRITDLATQIKAAQGPEIVQMTIWLDEWGVPGPDSMGMGDAMSNGAMGGMGGMLSESEMRALEDAEGVQAGRLFLQGMIVHHEGAIEMAETEIDSGTHEGTVDLARSIVVSQTREIGVMEDLLADG